MSDAQPTPPRPVAKQSSDLDDRGKPITPLSLPDLVKESVADDDRAARERLAAWLAKAGRRSQATRDAPMLWPTVYLMLLAASAGSVLLAVMFKHTQSWMLTVRFVLILAILVFAWRAVPRRFFRDPPSMVAEGFCGQCGYSLREIPVQCDGCIVCSECGAAWSNERLTWPWWSRPAPHWAIPAQALSRFEAARASRDANGRVVAVRRFRDLWVLAEEATGERRKILHAAEADILARTRATRLAGAGITVVASALFGLLAVALSANSRGQIPANAYVFLGFVIIGAAVVAFIMWEGGLFTERRHLVDALTSRGMCPSCTGVWPRELCNGKSIACPACGSTWLLPAKNEAAM